MNGLENLKSELIRRISDAGGQLRVRSALNPALWLCALVSTPLAVVAMNADAPLPWWLVAMILGPVISAIIGFIGLLIFDRGKLQSEDYQIRMRTLDLIQEKGQLFPITPISLEAISNPDKPALPKPPEQ